MPYVISGGSDKAAASFRRDSLEEALNKARELRAIGGGVSIADTQGNRIEGEELDACLQGEKTLTASLRTTPRFDDDAIARGLRNLPGRMDRE
jgi:hypothetical protein